MIHKVPHNYRIGFKVVRPNDELHSAVQHEARGRTYYKQFTWTQRKVNNQGDRFGGLAVFNNVVDAVTFAQNQRSYRGRMEVWLCLYQPSRCRYMWYFSYGSRKRRLHISSAPHGTRLADYVMLVEKVYPK